MKIPESVRSFIVRFLELKINTSDFDKIAKEFYEPETDDSLIVSLIISTDHSFIFIEQDFQLELFCGHQDFYLRVSCSDFRKSELKNFIYEQKQDKTISLIGDELEVQSWIDNHFLKSGLAQASAINLKEFVPGKYKEE